MANGQDDAGRRQQHLQADHVATKMKVKVADVNNKVEGELEAKRNTMPDAQAETGRNVQDEFISERNISLGQIQLDRLLHTHA